MNKEQELSSSYLLVDLSALKKNLSFFRSKINPSTKIMAMVKADAYGHGAIEIATELERKGFTDYFGVANTAKGVELRNAGIQLPIMITDPLNFGFEDIIHYQLEPVIYNWSLFQRFQNFCENHPKINKPYPVHLKFNTGMNRFGFSPKDAEEIKLKLAYFSALDIISVMSHLSCSDSPSEDDFTLAQLTSFNAIKRSLTEVLPKKTMFHILNTNGTIRFTEYQMDMVRIGIGIYGASDFQEARNQLVPIGKFYCKLLQIRSVENGESVSYSRSGKISKSTRIGIMSIGYADGFPRLLGNGNWQVEIRGKLYKTIGNVCMDYTLIDLGIENIEFEPEEEIILFGGQKSIYEFAKAQQTICYEALTNLGKRTDKFYLSDEPGLATD